MHHLFRAVGNNCILKHEEIFHVFSPAFATGDVEVSYVQGGISLAFTGNAPVSVTEQEVSVFLVL